MKQFAKKIVDKLLPGQPVRVIEAEPISGYAKLSFSQEGEDILLDRFFVNQKNGFYVDVGAHHPERFSNTNYYYLRGWRGLNIEADPDLLETFNKKRPRDINVNLAVGHKKKSLKFYVFNETALNTFDKKLADKRSGMPDYFIAKAIDLRVWPLEFVLRKYLPKNQVIDFMSVDVEGLDLEVLKSNDWKSFRPRFLLVECLSQATSLDISDDEVVSFLKKQDYTPFAKLFNTVAFKDTRG